MEVNLRTLMRRTILFALILTPIFSYGELLALLRGGLSLSSVHTPAFIKLIKDGMMALILAIGVVAMIRSGRVHRAAVPFAFLILYVLAAMPLAASVDPFLVVAGIRWIFPLFVAAALLPYADRELLRDIAGVLRIMFGLHFLMQLAQLFLMSSWYGRNFFGLAGRVPGMLMNPNSAGLFTILCLTFVHFYYNEQRFSPVLFLAAFASVVFTQSGTALIVFFFLILFLLLGVSRSRLLLPLAPVAAAGLIGILPILTGRTEIHSSAVERMRVFMRIFEQGEWFPQAFGSATNAAMSLGTVLQFGEDLMDSSAIADSTITSILGNLGMIGLLAFIAAGLLWLVVLFRTRRTDLYAATLIFTCYGITMIFFELFPMNLLFAVLLAYGVRELTAPRVPVPEPAAQALAP